MHFLYSVFCLIIYSFYQKECSATSCDGPPETLRSEFFKRAGGENPHQNELDSQFEKLQLCKKNKVEQFWRFLLENGNPATFDRCEHAVLEQEQFCRVLAGKLCQRFSDPKPWGHFKQWLKWTAAGIKSNDVLLETCFGKKKMPEPHWETHPPMIFPDIPATVAPMRLQNAINRVRPLPTRPPTTWIPPTQPPTWAPPTQPPTSATQPPTWALPTKPPTWDPPTQPPTWTPATRPPSTWALPTRPPPTRAPPAQPPTWITPKVTRTVPPLQTWAPPIFRQIIVPSVTTIRPSAPVKRFPFTTEKPLTVCNQPIFKIREKFRKLAAPQEAYYSQVLEKFELCLGNMETKLWATLQNQFYSKIQGRCQLAITVQRQNCEQLVYDTCLLLDDPEPWEYLNQWIVWLAANVKNNSITRGVCEKTI